MVAWHNDPALKERIVQRMRDHRAADDFIRGDYQRFSDLSPLGYRGCAIGCALDKQPQMPSLDDDCICSLCTVQQPAGGWHREFERQFGIIAEVAELIDDTYESLLPPDHAEFAVAALEAIPAGADLSRVLDQFHSAPRPSHRENLLLRLLSEAPVPEESTKDGRDG